MRDEVTHGPNLRGNYVAKITIPRQNKRDILSIEGFYRALAGIARRDGRYALEIHGGRSNVEFVIRADNHALFERIKHLVETHWPQSEVHLVSAEDVGVLKDPPPTHYVGSARLSLREPHYLPIWSPTTREGRSTYDDLQRGGDPMLSILSALHACRSENIRCVVQYVPVALPHDWAKPWRGNTNDLNDRLRYTPQNIVNIILGAIGGALLLVGLFFFLPLAILAQRPTDWALAFGGIALGAGCFVVRLTRPTPADPLVIYQKAIANGFRVGINLFAYGDTYQGVHEALVRLTNAYAAYNLPSANGFVSLGLDGQVGPDDFAVQAGRFDHTITALEMTFKSRKSPILSSIELSTLWHLPHETSAFQSLDYTTSRKISTGATRYQHGRHEIGYVEDGSDQYPLRLSASNLRGNIAIFAGTRSGKSNLISWLAKIHMEDDPDCSIIVIDPHQGLAEQILSNVPDSRADKCIYWDMSHREHCIGFNFLDRVRNVDHYPDRRMDNLVNGMKEIWPDNWGPRTEDFLRHSLLTLLAANQALVGEWTWRRWCYEVDQVFKRYQDTLRDASITLSKQGNIKLTHLFAYVPELRHFIDDINNMSAQLARLSPLLFEPRFEHGISALPEDYELFQPSHPKSCADFADAQRLAAFLQDVDTSSFEYFDRLAALKAIINSDHLRQIALSRATSNAADPAALAEEFFYGRIYGSPPHVLQYTLLDVSVLLNDFRMQRMLLHVMPPMERELLRGWWENTYERLAASGGRFGEMVAPIITKINAFSASHASNRVFGQSISTIDLKQIINDGWILVVNNAIGSIGEDTAALIGSSLLNHCASILYSRNRQQAKRRVIFILDEFHTMPGANYEALLSELGKYGAQTILATQSLALLQRQQRSGNKRYPVLENAQMLAVFRCSWDDAKNLAHEFVVGGGGNEDPLRVNDTDIVGLPSYTCFLRLRDKTGQPVVLRVRTHQAPGTDEQKVNAFRSNSIASFARPDPEIAEELRRASRLSNVSVTLNGGWEEPVSETRSSGRSHSKQAVF
jgi:hypothetical protein